jgi:type II secretory ATPase GspE/PulE/Tfp pilus assembly ATPase PilB-like protein
LHKAPAYQIKKKAQESGFITLREAGIEKVRLGITTPEEVMRVTEMEE